MLNKFIVKIFVLQIYTYINIYKNVYLIIDCSIHFSILFMNIIMSKFYFFFITVNMKS